MFFRVVTKKGAMPTHFRVQSKPFLLKKLHNILNNLAVELPPKCTSVRQFIFPILAHLIKHNI